MSVNWRFVLTHLKLHNMQACSIKVKWWNWRFERSKAWRNSKTTPIMRPFNLFSWQHLSCLLNFHLFSSSFLFSMSVNCDVNRRGKCSPVSKRERKSFEENSEKVFLGDVWCALTIYLQLVHLWKLKYLSRKYLHFSCSENLVLKINLGNDFPSSPFAKRNQLTWFKYFIFSLRRQRVCSKLSKKEPKGKQIHWNSNFSYQFFLESRLLHMRLRTRLHREEFRKNSNRNNFFTNFSLTFNDFIFLVWAWRLRKWFLSKI